MILKRNGILELIFMSQHIDMKNLFGKMMYSMSNKKNLKIKNIHEY